MQGRGRLVGLTPLPLYIVSHHSTPTSLNLPVLFHWFIYSFRLVPYTWRPLLHTPLPGPNYRRSFSDRRNMRQQSQSAQINEVDYNAKERQTAKWTPAVLVDHSVCMCRACGDVAPNQLGAGFFRMFMISPSTFFILHWICLYFFHHFSATLLDVVEYLCMWSVGVCVCVEFLRLTEIDCAVFGLSLIHCFHTLPSAPQGEHEYWTLK